MNKQGLGVGGFDLSSRKIIDPEGITFKGNLDDFVQKLGFAIQIFGFTKPETEKLGRANHMIIIPSAPFPTTVHQSWETSSGFFIAAGFCPRKQDREFSFSIVILGLVD